MSNISFEYLQSLIGNASGIAPLGPDGKLPDTYLPDTARGAFVGSYATLAELQAAHPTGLAGQYGLVAGKTYYWNTAQTMMKWNPEEITASAYQALTAEEKAGQPSFLIVP